ncbi:MAG: hypothetical protein GYA18_00775 [Chloroflexi bacterium]|nr:hypothetical protein [Chloroflexota bacterium]
MYQLDKDLARSVLLKQGHATYQIDILLKNYPSLQDEMGVVVEKWLRDQKIPDLEVDGLSIREVMETRRSSFLVAVRDLNRLLDASLPDEKRTQWRRILTTPVYYE